MKEESEYFRISLRFVVVGVNAVRRFPKGQQIKSKCPRTLPATSLRGESVFADIVGTELVDSEAPDRPIRLRQSLSPFWLRALSVARDREFVLIHGRREMLSG